MSFLSSWAPAWLEGLYEIVSRTGKIVYKVLTSQWQLTVILCSVLVGVVGFITPMASKVVEQSEMAWGVLNDSAEAMRAALDDGWPPAFAKAVWFANQWVPLKEVFLALAALFVLWFVCLCIRVVKSWLPTVN